MRRFSRFLGAMALLSLLAACGGNAPPPPPPPPVTGIGAAGGTVSDPSGAKVVVPAGALTTNIDIAVAQSSVGAPALPAGVTAIGKIFAFTPHGTTFASPVTITVPFDPALVPAGTVLALYKTNATQTAWIAMPGATVSGSTMSGAASGFSYAVVAPQPPEGFPELTEKSWRFDAYASNTDGPIVAREEDHQTGGDVTRNLNVGDDLILFPAGQDPPRAMLQVHSSENGKTFWTFAQAPRSLPDNPDQIDSTSSILTQTYTFKVRDPSASLKFIITVAGVETEDNGGNAPSPELCPFLDPTAAGFNDQCADMLMVAANVLTIRAHGVLSPDDFFLEDGAIALVGSADHWDLSSSPDDNAPEIFHDSQFDTNLIDRHAGRGTHAYGELKAPVTVAVPLSSLQVGDIFNVEVYSQSIARNLVQGESYVVAGMRDPVDFSAGASIEFTGLEQLPVNHDPAPPLTPVPCASPDPTAGQFEFGAAEFSAVEGPLDARVEIRRVGGAHGDVKVLLDTVDGSALAGSDYIARHLVVPFADGESGGKFVSIPLVVDKTAEPDETAQLTLTPFKGCATLGARPTATLKILDNDRPVAPPVTYAIGGSITGLAGSGLVLKELSSGRTVTASNGVFSLPGAFTDGAHYDVRVDTQPNNPLQQCIVTNGAGTIAGANVSNVQVTCASPAPSGALDPLFGSGGRVATDVAYAPGVSNARIGMALQSDGKILLVGGLTLLRFNADGTLDMNFGTGGQVHVPFNGGVFDTAQDVAAQADGKIIVVGFTGTAGASDDFALVRFNADGTLDSSFGTGGKANTDFAGSADRARRVYIQQDGKLLVTGFATFIASPTVASETFALARYNADGSLDTTFAAGGKAHDSPGGSFDFAQALAIQSDGKIVVVGGAASDGVSDPDVGLVRYLGDTGLGLPGWRDESFGALGNGVVQSNLGLATGWEEADDVVIAADGTLILAGRVRAGVAVGGSDFGFVLVTFGSDGRQKGGALITKFTNLSDNARAMALQSDGKIVVVGQSGNLSSNPDMAIVRYAATGLSYDTDFGTDGKLTVDFFGGIDGAEAIAQQPDGKLVVGGFARFNGQTKLALIRLLP